MSKWCKVAFFAALAIGAGFLFGTVCGRTGEAYALILAPSRQLLGLLLRLLLAIGALAVSAGFVVALVRPVWVGFIAFTLAGLAMLLGWQVAVPSGILVALYLLGAFVYAVGVARELNERIAFSVRPIAQGQGVLLMSLMLVACGSLYLGTAAHVEQEGFSIPESYLETLMEQMEKRIETQVPAEERAAAVAEFRQEFQRTVDEFLERTVKPYERFIPLGIAVSAFMSLLTITRLLAWVPTAVLDIGFRLLAALRVTETVLETREVQRLVLG